MNRLLRLFVLSISQLVLITQVGWAADGQMPLQGMQEDDTGYVLTLKTQPAGAGFFNRDSGKKYAAGEDIEVYYYGNDDFVFDHWESEGKKLSTERYLTFTMPSHDAELIAVFRYEPGNPADPNAYEKKYALTLTAEPKGACSFNFNSGEKFVAGEEVYTYFYKSDDYVFDHWESEGKNLSTDRYLTFIMPKHDAELKAIFNYSPQNPVNPDTAKVMYTVTLETSPKGAGYFSWSNVTEVLARRSCSIYAYTNTDFVFREWQQDGKTVSTDYWYSFEMPYENIKLVAVYDFKPTNPGNPGSNYWNAETGEAIVDDFAPGYLLSATDNATGSARDKVLMLTVGGKASDSDWGILYYYTSCSYLDLSRSYGMTTVPSYNFSGNEVLTDIILPASIKSIQSYAFRNCTSLQHVSCFALTPPTLDSRAFEGAAEGLVVFVPVDAVSLYQDAEVWKDFTILPLSADVSALQVNLPSGTNPALYKDMFIELINTKSGQKQRYVITDRLTYTFNSLPHNSSYMVQLVNQNGDVLGKIEDIYIQKEDVSATFGSLSVPKDLKLTVFTPDGTDVTDQVMITWLDEKETYLTRGNALTGQLEGVKNIIRMQLSQALGMVYIQPADLPYTVEATNDITYTLKAIPKISISGTVKDIKTGKALSGAVVAISQTLNGQYSKAYTTKTDSKGNWTQEVFKTKTDITASATNYVSDTQNFDDPIAEVPAFELKEINGTTISLNLTYTNTDGETQSYYSDYTNIAYTVENATAGKQISELNVQYPQIVLMDQLAEGNLIRVTATSKNNSFMPVSATGTVDELGHVSVTLPIKQLGGISASFKSTDNTSVVGILYDAVGKLIKKYDYSTTTLSISDLADGVYTLVTMANSSLFNSISDLTQFRESGLKEDVDYVKDVVTVKSAAIATVSRNLIPALDESKLYYTGNNTSFSANKLQVTAGQYLTLSGRVDFKSTYANTVSDVKILVDIPESTSFVDNSVMVGNSLSSYTIEKNRLVIPLTNLSDRVRLCIIPISGGEYSATASVQFTNNGKTIIQPIGNANYVVKDLNINVPPVIAKTSVPVSGIAVGKSQVDIYDNGLLIGQTTALANGTYAATAELDNPYNLSTHDIYARVTTPQGIVMQSETKSVTYDANAIQVSAVTMYHLNPEQSKTYEVVFDFLNPSEKASTYVYYIYNKDFTFTIDFTNNDPEKVTNVVLYVKTGKDGKWTPLNASFDEKKQKWVAAGQFGNMYDGNIPVNVRVAYHVDTEKVLDSDMFGDLLNLQGAAKNTLTESLTDFDALYNSYEKAVAEGKDEEASALLNEMLVLAGYDQVDLSEPRMDAEALQALKEAAEADNIQLQSVYDNLMNGTPFDQEGINEYMQGVTYGHATGMTPESLLADNFETVSKTDGTVYYIKIDGSKMEFVDLASDLHVTIAADVAEAARRKANSDEDWLKKIGDLSKTIQDWCSKIMGLFDDCVERIGKTIAQNEKLLNEAQKAYATRYIDGLSTSQIKELEKSMAKYTKEIEKSKGIHKVLDNDVRPYLGSGKTTGSKVAGKAFSLFALVMDGIDAYQNVSKLVNLKKSISSPCEKADNAAEALRSDISGWVAIAGGYYVVKLGADIAELCGFSGGLAGLIPSGGSSATAILAAAGVLAINLAADIFFTWRYNKAYDRFCKKYRELYKLCDKEPCDGEKPCPPNSDPEDNNDDGEDSGNPDCNPQIDPSGYVYEGVASNRLQGVTASCYYKEIVEDMYGDLHENIVLWNAEEYAQKNPLFTDENGMYQWDVPQGLWQVKFEKEGYQTTYSEWLPVPPPQLEVNIPMVQMRQPTVSDAKAYDLGVEIAFDKYMDPETLTTDNISVTKNGNKIEGSIVLLNEEVSYEGEETTFASKLRFEVPKGQELTTTDQVMLTVSKAVKSYAGVQMENDYSQEFDVLPIVRKILADSLVNVVYGGERKLTVAAAPADAAKGKTLTVKSMSEMIAKPSDESLTFDENGQAELTVTGELPGSTVLSFMVDGSDVEGTVVLNVKDAANMITKAPDASRVSGTEVYSGTKIILTSETDGATIYYTLDGSCPCDSKARLTYNPDEPIVITEDNVVIKAIAQGVDLPESDVKEFAYTLKKSSLNYQMPQDWKWISHNLSDPVKPTDFQNVERIVSQTEEVINDPKAGLIGNLQALLPTEAYKVKTSVAYEKLLQGYEFNASANAIPLETGWNWIGYPISQTMAIGEALAFFTPSEGDIIVGQDGSAEFVNGNWSGTLAKMTPSQGYLYKSGKKAEIEYNTSIVSNAASRLKNIQNLGNSPWAYNKYAYANIMPVTAQLFANNIKVSEDEYIVGAFAGTECRGIGSWIDGRLMMNVYGDGGEDIRFIAFNTSDEQYYNLKENVTFTADNIGNWRSPYFLSIGGQTTDIEQQNGEFSVTPTVVSDYIIVSAGARNINRVTLTNTGGLVVMTVDDLGSGGTITTSSVPEGVYIVTIQAEGQNYYKKIIKTNK